jgi:hypothetical protein
MRQDWQINRRFGTRLSPLACTLSGRSRHHLYPSYSRKRAGKDFVRLKVLWIEASGQNPAAASDARMEETHSRSGLSVSSAAGRVPLAGPGLASQPTHLRFIALMADPANLKPLRKAVPELAGRGIRAERRGKRMPWAVCCLILTHSM